MRAIVVPSLAALLLVSACGGRSANPVAVTRSSDSALSCQQLQSEYTFNRRTIDELRQEDLDRQGQNAAVAGLVLLVGVGALVAMDTGEAQDTETEALLRRNLSLAALAEQNDCDQLTPSMNDVIARVEAEKAERAAAAKAREEARKQAEEYR